MVDFLINGRVEHVEEPWETFIVYGSFDEPNTGKNFIVVRMPSGRVPWSKKIAPAINKLVKQWYHQNTKEKDRFWNLEGENVVGPRDIRLWDTTTTVRYEWNGTELVRVLR